MTLAATRCGVSYPVLVDEEDALLVAPFHWNIGTDGYAGCTGPGGKRLLMHRLILDAPPNLYTDHINGDRRDNRRANLRLCTPQENNRNRPVPNKNGYKGVLFHSRPANKKYQARITVDRRTRSLGYFDSAEEAARAYDAAAKALFGDFAHLNFPPP